jgi:hypothetical protein
MLAPRALDVKRKILISSHSIDFFFWFVLALVFVGIENHIASISSFFHPFRIWKVQQLMRMQALAS